MCLLDHNALIGLSPGSTTAISPVAFPAMVCNRAGRGGGRGLAELIVDGRYRTLDLGDLSPARVFAGKALLERNVI